MTNREIFAAAYVQALTECVQDPRYKESYCYGPEKVPAVASKMLGGLDAGETNITDSPAFKLACKRLGIKYTLKAIATFRGAA